MTSTLIITGSPSAASRTSRHARAIVERLAQHNIESSVLDVRTLPAEDLLGARAGSPTIAAALERVAGAKGVVVATPIYKAAYSGLLKTFLDVLPQFGLREKVVLPLATGGTVAHVLALDYALRPVLSSLDPSHVVSGLFILDKQIIVHSDGRVELDPDVSARLDQTLANFVDGLRRLHGK